MGDGDKGNYNWNVIYRENYFLKFPLLENIGSVHFSFKVI